MMGSHQDTVRQGGRYDGILGVVVPLACVEALHGAGERGEDGVRQTEGPAHLERPEWFVDLVHGNA